MADFKDHFSRQSDEYSLYRPEYPADLYKYLASLCNERELAWDCATGNGQAARGLSQYYTGVRATDASANQINAAKGPDNIVYSVGTASSCTLSDNVVDIVTVAQALHWFDLDRFYSEVDRVLKPGGVLAIWCYGLMNMNDALDKVFFRLYEDILGEYWPEERQHIENGYADFHFPYELIDSPTFEIEVEWSLDQLLGYFRSWSATTKYIAKTGVDPVLALEQDFAKAWGDVQIHTITWPLTLKIGRK